MPWGGRVMDPRTPVDELRVFAEQLRQIRDRLDLLEAPSGTSAFRTVAKLQTLVEDIQAQLDAWATTRWTNAQIVSEIDSRVATRLTQDQVDQRIYAIVGSILAGNVSIGGALSVSGTVTLPGARGTSVATASGRVAAWIASDGRLGHTA